PVLGPGTLIAGGVVLLLIIFAIIGLASGGESKHSSKTARSPHHGKGHGVRQPPPRRRPAPPSTVTLKVSPVEPTYVCVDEGSGQSAIFEGIISSDKTFHGKR